MKASFAAWCFVVMCLFATATGLEDSDASGKEPVVTQLTAADSNWATTGTIDPSKQSSRCPDGKFCLWSSCSSNPTTDPEESADAGSDVPWQYVWSTQCMNSGGCDFN